LKPKKFNNTVIQLAGLGALIGVSLDHLNHFDEEASPVDSVLSLLWVSTQGSDQTSGPRLYFYHPYFA